MNKKNRLYSVITGSRLCLVPFKRRYITKRYLKWMNDGEVTRHLSSGGNLITIQDLYKYYQTMKDSSKDFLFAIEIRNGKRHIGNIRLGPVDWKRKTSDMGIMIGEKNYWGKDYGREALHLLLKFAFVHLLLKEVIAGARSLNKGAKRLYKKAGFRIKKIVKGTYMYKGKMYDAHYFSITDRDFLKLKDRRDFFDLSKR